MKMLIRTYKEWSFQLYPSFAFEDVISKTNTFSCKSAVKTKLDDLRQTECQRYMRDVLGVVYQPSASYDDIASDTSPNNTTVEESSPPGAESPHPIGGHCQEQLDDAELLAMVMAMEQGSRPPTVSSGQGTGASLRRKHSVSEALSASSVEEEAAADSTPLEGSSTSPPAPLADNEGDESSAQQEEEEEWDE